MDNTGKQKFYMPIPGMEYDDDDDDNNDAQVAEKCERYVSKQNNVIIFV